MLARFYVYLLSMMFMAVSARHLSMEWRFESDFMHYCLYYDVADELPDYDDGWHGLSQIIPYCIRPEPIEHLTLVPSTIEGIIHPFEELRREQITSGQLYGWSDSADLAECYQMYLNNQNDSSCQQVFYNCTRPWFGEFCQYRFEDDQSLPNIVKLSFLSKQYQLEYMFQVTNLSCYVHLPCRVGPAPMCLDWRDICDGKIDCLDNNMDERDCGGLETNICNTDELQCHNGQCIPTEFFDDDPANPDCWDGSDESGRFACDEDPSIRCEDGSHQFGYYPTERGTVFNCGDGNPKIIGYRTICRNRRALLFLKTLFSKSSNPSLSSQCWSAMVHYLQLQEDLDVSQNTRLPCYTINARCTAVILANCPPLFTFPASPALLGHVYFYYSNKQSINKLVEDKTPAQPMYVCYNEHLCPFLPWTIRINDSTCRPFSDLSEKSGWFDVLSDLVETFRSCSTNGIGEGHCARDGFFSCENSSKCIPNRRLMDGTADCVDASDERNTHACKPYDPLRFSCKSESKCLSHLVLYNGVKDCVNGEDEREVTATSKKDGISFATICDGFIEVNFETYLKNRSTETDESHCDLWPCSNVYTRCDEFWNCPNGLDELHCPPLSGSCSEKEFLCVSPVTFQLICVPFVNADDGHVDCLGGSDERFHCRQVKPDTPEDRYRCWNSTKCIRPDYLCEGSQACPFEDDVRFCDKIQSSFGYGICSRYIENPDLQRHPSFQFLCALEEEYKPGIMYFVLTEREPRSTTLWEERIINHLSATDYTTGSLNMAWLCNRGLLVQHRNEEELIDDCLCPPAYYGNRCQFQNQRVSLSYRLQTFEILTVFHLHIMLIDQTTRIHSYEQRFYLGAYHCNIQFGLNLLYSDRPKNNFSQYTVRIDLFEKVHLKYRSSWQFPVQFSILPVYRIAALLTIPFGSTSYQVSNCVPDCLHGECSLYTNTKRAFCRCFPGWFGETCEQAYRCNCANGSVCIGPDQNNNTICVCPLGKYGPRCLLTRSSCSPNPCFHNGLCVPEDERISEDNFSCICSDGYMGMRCEHEESRIEISFVDIPIPLSIFIHFVTVESDGPSFSYTVVKKIPLDQDSGIINQASKYHLIFVQISDHYYLAFVQSRFLPGSRLNLPLNPSKRCPQIDELLNASVMASSLLRRMKYYHLPCRENQHLSCFYDEDRLCICTNERHANCLNFDHKMTYDCQRSIYCQNGALCFQDHPTCPSSILCVCKECFFGSRCQFNTKGYSLSLDFILGYQIRPRQPFGRQATSVKVSLAMIVFLFILGLINGTISIITFLEKDSQKLGTGIYLLASSIISIFVTAVFTLKFSLVILSQKRTITHQSILTVSCVAIDILLDTLLSFTGWLHAAVAIERSVTVIQEVHFDGPKSIRIARKLIPCLLSLVILTKIHDPLHRKLVDDFDEKRTWCVTSYSSEVQLYNSIMTIGHFLSPFVINLTSAVIIIMKITRIRFKAGKQMNYQTELRKHGHLLISPIILVILTLPRLIISFTTGCMQSTRDPWLLLFAYLIACVPSNLTFVIFVLTSDTYKNQFVKAMKQKRRALKRIWAR